MSSFFNDINKFENSPSILEAVTLLGSVWHFMWLDWGSVFLDKSQRQRTTFSTQRGDIVNGLIVVETGLQADFGKVLGVYPCKTAFPLPTSFLFCHLWEEVIVCSSCSRSRVLATHPWRQNIYVDFLKFFSMGSLFLLSHFLIYSIICVTRGPCMFYFML